MITLAATDTLQGKAGTASVITYTILGDRLTTTDAFEKIAQGQLASTTDVLYTVPASTSVLIKEVHLANTSASVVTGIVLYVGGTAASNQITGTISIPANGTATYTSEGGWKIYDGTGVQQVSTIGFSMYRGPSLVATPATFGAVETIVHQVQIPANGLYVGTTYRVVTHGIITATGPTLLGRLRLGTAGTTSDTQVCATAATAVATGTGWMTDFYVTIRTTGAGGTALGNGILEGTAPAKTAQTATVAVNTTVQNFLSMTLIGGGTVPVVTVVNAFSTVMQP